MEEHNHLENKLIKERTRKFLEFFKKYNQIVFYLILIALVILGIYIRYLPLSDHDPNTIGVQPGLWDITTNDYTLGPDLDPFLFLRYAQEMINQGSLSKLDTMRSVPLGFDTSKELQMVSYMIVITYKILNLFGDYSINFSGAFMPVWIFGLTILAFFFFVREIFIRKNKDSILKANIISFITTAFMIIMPGFLSRTVAGIPEKESIAFLFMFLALYLFLKAWKSSNIITASILGILAGISTGLMGLTWGGVQYLYVALGLSGLIGFILNKFKTKESLVYCLWLISAIVITFAFTNKYDLKSFIFGFDTGLASLVVVIIISNLILWRTNLAKILKLDKIKLPKNIITLIFIILLGLILILIFNPQILTEKSKQLYQILINPLTGRWDTTVAENRQPYFTEWLSSFGTGFFWLFIIGSIWLLGSILDKFDKKEKFTLLSFYIIFLWGLIFSRYSSQANILNGESIISKIIYFGSAMLFFVSIIYFYIKSHKQNRSDFENIDQEYLILFSLFILCLFTARSAIRLIMVLVPIAPIFLSFLLVDFIYSIKSSKDEAMKIILVIIAIALILFTVYTAYNYYKSITQESYYFIPSSYTQQWQKAMSWVRENTVESAVFAHWWDYGYWVQSIGNRPTITDGGNIITWWNYMTGRYVLTTPEQQTALNFLKAHNASYLLIDSTDVGKYGAFSQIGSDENYDRFSSGPITLFSDKNSVTETKNGTLRSYYIPSGTNQIALIPLEEDLIYNSSTLFKENSALAKINIGLYSEDSNFGFSQPQAIFLTSNKQITLPIRYIYYDKKLYDFGFGIEAAVYVIPYLESSAQGLQMDPTGSLIYISPRLLRGMLSQVYLLDNSFKNFNNFELAYTQDSPVVEYIKSQGTYINDFVYYQGLQGPIKIWKINYKGNEQFKEEFLDKDSSKYISWKL